MLISRDFVLTGAVTATGLSAGTFFAFTVGVMPGLHRLDDHDFVAAMRAINDVIVNPAFMVAFCGAPLLAIAAAATRSAHRPWLIAGAGLIAATFLITAAVNVPLNDKLAAGGSRHAFETPWVIANALRTVLSLGALGCLARAALAD